jgi:hypothetical protein
VPIVEPEGSSQRLEVSIIVPYSEQEFSPHFRTPYLQIKFWLKNE